ncbi:metal-dependent hydrolase [Nonomuraea sp. SMC257]|uniref:Metal-dependent hydrolase n=1 Tax=Nonomuraea montanisoli TaxID=2741721 RepID=A0A7Y6M1V4_9ACTN|nr:metal-dependent hydrolase [Nonomuraea montanisoli]NUW31487.1 metal-dependent hydrolase [Nonomuraea montanisoli]
MVHQSGPLQESLYLEDTYLTGLSGPVAATGQDEDGGAWIALRRNIFHPQGGGQPADRGRVGACAVTPARHAATGLVVLRAVDDTGPGLGDLAEGDVVEARLDADLRLLHAALHTAGHLVEAAARAEGWSLAGNNHFPGQARIELTAPEAGGSLAEPEQRDEAADRLRAFVAAAVAGDLPVVAGRDPEGRRVVRLGDLHAAPCGGTHVRSLGDLAEVTISGVKLKKGRVRVSYSAAHRPPIAGPLTAGPPGPLTAGPLAAGAVR